MVTIFVNIQIGICERWRRWSLGDRSTWWTSDTMHRAHAWGYRTTFEENTHGRGWWSLMAPSYTLFLQGCHGGNHAWHADGALSGEGIDNAQDNANDGPPNHRVEYLIKIDVMVLGIASHLPVSLVMWKCTVLCLKIHLHITALALNKHGTRHQVPFSSNAFYSSPCPHVYWDHECSTVVPQNGNNRRVSNIKVTVVNRHDDA